MQGGRSSGWNSEVEEVELVRGGLEPTKEEVRVGGAARTSVVSGEPHERESKRNLHFLHDRNGGRQDLAPDDLLVPEVVA